MWICSLECKIVGWWIASGSFLQSGWIAQSELEKFTPTQLQWGHCICMWHFHLEYGSDWFEWHSLIQNGAGLSFLFICSFKGIVLTLWFLMQKPPSIMREAWLNIHLMHTTYFCKLNLQTIFLSSVSFSYAPSDALMWAYNKIPCNLH